MVPLVGEHVEPDPLPATLFRFSTSEAAQSEMATLRLLSHPELTLFPTWSVNGFDARDQW
jgi:hypothetical protein